MCVRVCVCSPIPTDLKLVLGAGRQGNSNVAKNFTFAADDAVLRTSVVWGWVTHYPPPPLDPPEPGESADRNEDAPEIEPQRDTR